MKAEPSVTIISACTARKQDSIPIPQGAKIVQPEDYLDDKNLIEKLFQTRKKILADPKAKVGTKSTYAFDLYVNTGNAYKEIRRKHYAKIKALLTTGKIEWFFLSGGYGIINALEPAKKYQATFNRSIHYLKKIPFTTALWKNDLIKICDNLIRKSNSKNIYVFGSQDYTAFVKQTGFWKTANEKIKGMKIFESTGSAGPYWLSRILGELAGALEKRNLDFFNQKFPLFLKQ